MEAEWSRCICGINPGLQIEASGIEPVPKDSISSAGQRLDNRLCDLSFRDGKP